MVQLEFVKVKSVYYGMENRPSETVAVRRESYSGFSDRRVYILFELGDVSHLL